MVYMLVATDTRDVQFYTGQDWRDGFGQLILGFVHADDYFEDLKKGAEKYEIGEEYIDAYALSGDS